MGSRVKRRLLFPFISVVGAIVLVTSLILLASVSLIVPVQAVTVESPYPYGDATENGLISATDIARVKKIILGQQLPTPTADATANGLISATDIARVKKIILGQATATTRHQATYNFSTRAGTSRIAMWKNVAALPSDNFSGEAGWTEATSAQYTSLSAEGGGIWTIGGSAGTYTALQCKFPIDEAPNASDITSIGVTLVGSSETEGDLLQFWAWKTTGGWTQVGSDMSMTTTTATYTAWTAWGEVYADYIDVSGYMYILLIHNTLDKDLNVDYVELAISTPTECTTLPDDTPPADVTDLAVTDTACASITLSWIAPADDGSDVGSGNATEYDIRYSTSTITEANFGSATECTGEPAPGTPNTTQTFTVTNLTEAQIYYFALKTADEIPNWSNISNVVNECPHHPTHDVGDWWMWKVYYNTDGEGGIPLENTVYEILNVFEVDVYTNVTPCSGCTPVTVGPCDHSNINMDEVDRQRAKPASIGDARVVFRDTEQWAGMYHMLPVRQDALMEVFDTALGIGDGDMLANNWFTHSDDFGNTTYGYPSPVGETWYEHQYILAVGAITQEFEYDSVINVTSYIENYDMSDPANCPDVQGVGVYDVGYSEQLFEGTTDIAMEQWYSCEVQTPVRRIDYVTYYGYEDRVIIAYEVADFQKSNLVVSDKSGNIDVSINVTNPTASTQTYNMLLLIMDMDAQTTPATGSPSDYFNGKTVFPDMANPETPGTWPYYDAIQQVEVAGGATETVTWTDVYISDGGPYTVWCSGLTESW